MYLEEIINSKFAEINDKKYCFCNGIVSFPFFHPHFKEIIAFKQEKQKQKNRNVRPPQKHKLLAMEKKCSVKKDSLYSKIFFFKIQHFITLIH